MKCGALISNEFRIKWMLRAKVEKRKSEHNRANMGKIAARGRRMSSGRSFVRQIETFLTKENLVLTKYLNGPLKAASRS
jgi:hypothetical protein